MIKYFVRTTLDRTFDYDLEYELLIDKERKPVDSFIKQLKYISEYDAVLLEDDLILCKDFKNKIEEVIEQYPNDIINFFYKPNYYFTTHYDSVFYYNQCTYYPKGVALAIANEMEKIRKIMPNAQYDVLESQALSNLGMRHLVYRPCLIQHLDKDSLIQEYDSKGSRISPFFIDWLDELGISYDDAHKQENLRKLREKIKELQINNKGDNRSD